MSGVDPVNIWIGTAFVDAQYVWFRTKRTYIIAKSHVDAGDPDLSRIVFFIRLTVWKRRSAGF